MGKDLRAKDSVAMKAITTAQEIDLILHTSKILREFWEPLKDSRKG